MMNENRFEVFSSLMIALVTILGAITAWRANIASVSAGDADFDGLSASIRAQEARIVNAVRAYEHYRAFTDYYRYNAIGDEISANQAIGEGRETSELWGVAEGLQSDFFNPRYLDLDGRYDIQRELDELWADSKQRSDLDAEPHFALADALREKSNYHTMSLIVFAAAFFFFALGQAIDNNLKYLVAMAGIAATLGGICLIFVFEFG